MSGGSGWVLLTYSPRGGRLVSQWPADHIHGLGGGAPILALDMYGAPPRRSTLIRSIN